MGLDMYLIRKKYIGAKYDFNNVKGKIEITIGGKVLPIEFNRLAYIEEDVGYWRKANAIHNWFVQNVQDGVDDCKDYYVSTDDLKELLGLCKEVKEKAILKDGEVQNGYRFGENGEKIPIMEKGKFIENAQEIADILPTASGFFFGSTDYDEYYLEDINETINIIETLLKDEKELNELGFYSEFVYHASW